MVKSEVLDLYVAQQRLSKPIWAHTIPRGSSGTPGLATMWADGE